MFSIKWDGERYRVSIPNYDGGDVLTKEDHEQALAEKDLELELADFTIKESLEKIAAMDKEIQQIREHEFQRGYQEAEEKYQQQQELT